MLRIKNRPPESEWGEILPPPPSPGCATGKASTVSCLSRDRRSDRSSIIAERSRSTLSLTWVTCSAAMRGYRAGPQCGRMGWRPTHPFLLEILTNIGRVINSGSRERVLGGAEFQKCTQCLKSNQISLAYDLTSNKDQAFITRLCFVFLLYRGLSDFVPFSGTLGGDGRVWTSWIRLWRSWIPAYV